MTLHELAERMGVETQRDIAGRLRKAGIAGVWTERPDLEIAHDMLPGLTNEWGETLWELEYSVSDKTWCWEWYDTQEAGSGTFIECVCELASRHIGGEKR